MLYSSYLLGGCGGNIFKEALRPIPLVEGSALESIRSIKGVSNLAFLTTRKNVR